MGSEMCIRDRRAAGQLFTASRPKPDAEPDGHATLSHVYGSYGDCLLYTSDAADERSSVDLGGRRIITKKK